MAEAVKKGKKASYPDRTKPLTEDKPLTQKEQVFVDEYIKTGNGKQSVIKAGYKVKNPEVLASNLLRKINVNSEILKRQQEMHDETIADAKEILRYFTKVLRGEEKDQFGLEAPLSERTKAAQELAKRTIDVENRLNGKADATVNIVLDWKRDTEE